MISVVPDFDARLRSLFDGTLLIIGPTARGWRNAAAEASCAETF